MLRQHAEFGGKFTLGQYNGYNEVILDADTIRSHPRRSVMALFITDCHDGQANTAVARAHTCKDARNHARFVHRRFLEEYGLSEREFPLLRFRPRNWEEPFAVDGA